MYSTVAALRFNNREIDVVKHASLDDTWCEEVIAQADRWVRTKVQPIVSGTIPDTAPPTCAEPITTLSEYAASHLALIKMYSRGRSPRDQSDIKGAKEQRDEYLVQVETRQVNLEYRDGLTTNYREDGRKPAFGEGKYGERITSDTPGDEPDEYETREDT